MSALNNIRVLDLSRGPAAGLASMILADFGAEVIALEDAQSDDLFETLPAATLWRRGKRHASTPDKAGLTDLLVGADVFLTTLNEPELVQRGLDYETLKQQTANLIYCHISGFGGQGPFSDLPGYEHLVAAASGRMMTFQGTVDRQGPVFSALQVGIHATAQSTVSGILAALWRRFQTGLGAKVETSLLQGMLPYEQGAMIAHQFPERFAGKLPTKVDPNAPIPTLFYHPTQASDGQWVQFGNLLPHLFDNYLMVTDLVDVLADADFNATQLMLPPPKQEAFRQRMLERIQEQSADDWMSLCIENGGVVAGKFQTTQEALNDADIVDNGHVIDRADGGRELGPLARLSKNPAQPGNDTPLESLPLSWTSAKANNTEPSDSDGHKAAPLAGVKVLELATIIAAPLGASFLADLGAEVIKVEQIGGDPYRGFSFGVGSARVNAGKRSISLNLKSPAGQKIVNQLASQADILIHNYRPGVPERLGFGYASIQALNPNLIYLQCNGYGPDGPGALRPCTHPIPGASMGGVLFQMGHRVPDHLLGIDELRLWASRLMRANEVNPDPNTALVVASSALLGLVARATQGEGQQIFVDMFGANAYANHDDFLTYPNKSPRALPDEGLHGLGPTYRLYPCAESQWVFLAIPKTGEQGRFLARINEAGNAELDASIFSQPDTAIESALTDLFLTDSADYWETLLTSARIGCVRADRHDPADYWLESTQATANGLTHSAEHPAWGSYQRHGANVRFDDQSAQLMGPPLGGQHSREILSELGYSNDEIDSLFKNVTTWSEVVE
ncbi:MAG: crotonobetainyl-CoA:carnitine CoA-transferase CaiB-like acyl-CoA transferase [Limisphaerales bacterium]|jgi:crotonobetainyl-CoA:carnitine CoA-transferase CaiB-like acyl-CoA transferase